MVGKKLIRNFVWIFLIGSLNAQNYDKIEEINYLPDSLFYNGLDSLNGNGVIDILIPVSSAGINNTLHFKVDTTYNYFDILSISFFSVNDSSLSTNETFVGMSFLDQMPWYQDINQVWYNLSTPPPWQNLTPIFSILDTLEEDSSTLITNYSNQFNWKWSWFKGDLSNYPELQDLTSNEIWLQFGTYFGLPAYLPLDSTFYHNFYTGTEFYENGNNFVRWKQSKSIHILCKIKIGYHDLPNSIEENSSTPKNFKLSQNFPNPFNPTTSINYEFETPNYEFGALTIFNVLGEEVKSFKLSEKSGTVVWDGKNNFGKKVSSGVYLYQLKFGNQSQTKKMLLLK
ncbi:MAG: T9SS C-terminal target domain-containing protein [Calditrichaeota bacterium]|nr:MAG: T9SS C-terminal target domain-containing protein [Calditrichota bacterium]